MIEIVRVMHVSDTHLGAKEYSMDMREEDVYEAFSEALDIAINERVDFIAHSGDLFDVWSPSNRALSEFKNGARRIHEKEIPMYLIMGDHDRPKRVDFPAARIFDFLGVKLLGVDGYESTSVKYDGEEVLIGGISNIKGLRVDNLLDAYRKAEEDAKMHRSSLLLSHQAISPYFFPEAACETTKDNLPNSFKYLAFGHVHDHWIRTNPSLFSYAGSTDIASVSEIPGFLKTGKGVNIVDLDRGEVDLRRVKLNSVRYQYSINDATPDNYYKKIEEILNKKRENDKKPVLSMTVIGDCDTRKIISEVKGIEDVIMRFPIKFQSEREQSRENVESKVSNSLLEYLERYFNSAEKAQQASDIMKTLDSEDSEEAYRLILKKYGLGFMEGVIDN